MQNAVQLVIVVSSLLLSFNTTYAMEIKTYHDAMMYLYQYGYMKKPDDFTSRSEPDERNGIMMFQKFAGLKETSKFDKETMEKMNMPRCGNKERMDILRNEQMTPDSRGSGWKYSDIHYRIINFPKSGLSPQVVRNTIKKAFAFWERVADISSVEVGPSDDIHVEVEISFEKNDHGDGFRFGQRAIGEAVAHAFFPEVDPDHEGDIHFDNDRGWTVDTKDGINFLQLCVHEIGHALGLKHSMVPSAVMHMLVKSNYDPNFELHSDDIRGIRNLYGRKIHVKPAAKLEKIKMSELAQKYHVNYKFLMGYPIPYFRSK